MENKDKLTNDRDCGGIAPDFENNVDYVKRVIKQGIPDSIVELTDFTRCGHDTDHINVTVVSNLFKGKSIIDQHRMVMNLLNDGMRTRIHAVKIKTITLEKFNENK
jgi:stress-induced morphogen